MATDEKSLTRHESQDKICFVIMPFTTPEGHDLDHFEKVYDQIFVPAIKAAGY